MDKKEEIRKRLLELRSSISEDSYFQKSTQIVSTLQQLPEFQQATVIHCYVSMNERREVNTHALIEEMMSSGKKVVVPITQTESGTLRHVLLRSFADLNKNAWGVLEPNGGEDIPIKKLDLIIVPMVGGDLRKNRIGYGKGFYDRFLANIECPIVGLLFEDCLVEKIPVESFDVSLDQVITEKKIIK